MNLHAVAQEIKERLDPLFTERVFIGAPDSVTPACFVIPLPEAVDFDATYRRGADSVTGWEMLAIVSKVTDRNLFERVAAYCAGNGASSVKQALESASYDSCDSVVVTRVETDTVTWQGTDFQGAMFMIDVFGAGSTA